MSTYFTDACIKDEEWTLETLSRWTRTAHATDDDDDHRAARAAAAEALAAHPNSDDIKAFITTKGLA